MICAQMLRTKFRLLCAAQCPMRNRDGIIGHALSLELVAKPRGQVFLGCSRSHEVMVVLLDFVPEQILGS
jgi:hypothetical protein